MIPFDLYQHRFHTICDTILTLPHQLCHGLIHFHYFSLSRGEGDLDAFAVPMLERQCDSISQGSIAPKLLRIFD